MGEVKWDTICGSGLRREAEPSLGEVPAHVGWRDAAAEVLGCGSCACWSLGGSCCTAGTRSLVLGLRSEVNNSLTIVNFFTKFIIFGKFLNCFRKFD